MRYNDIKEISALNKVDTDTWNTLRDHIRLRLINSKLINKYGDDIAIKKLNDVSVCLSVQEQVSGTTNSYILTHEDMHKYGVSVDNAFEQGLGNSSHDRNMRIMSFKQYAMKDTVMFPLANPIPSPIVVGDTPTSATGMIDDVDPDTGRENILCVLNKSKAFGAAYLACPDVLEDIYARFGENYYVLPLSVHEFMCIRQSYATQNDSKPIEWVEDDLLEMLERINDKTENSKDILSYKLYYYLGDDGKKLFPITN